MGVAKSTGIGLAALGVLALVATWPVVGGFAARAKLAQRVEASAEAQLFGEQGTPIGSPQLMIIDDPRAYIGQKTPGGAELVDERYLREHGIYPLQMQTVEYLAGVARVAFGLLALFGLALAWQANRRAQQALAREP